LWVRPGAYPRAERCFTRVGSGWKDLPGTNTLAYYENP
jgi:hypothetical protein